MKAVLFVEREGVKFKCDTFWSMSKIPRNAKIYSNDSIESLRGWLYPVISGYLYKNKDKTMEESIQSWNEWICGYNDAKLGYFTPDDSLYESQFYLKDIDVSDLGKPTYLWSIIIKDSDNWIINISDDESIEYDVDSIRDFVDYKQIHRDELIGDILNKKESE